MKLHLLTILYIDTTRDFPFWLKSREIFKTNRCKELGISGGLESLTGSRGKRQIKNEGATNDGSQDRKKKKRKDDRLI